VTRQVGRTLADQFPDPPGHAGRNDHATVTQHSLSDILLGMDSASVEARARRHAALADPMRLSIVDELAAADRSPVELRRRLGVESNLLAHHLDVLERAGMINRSPSSGDGRRRYVHLVWTALAGLGPRTRVPVGPALFVCTRNSARSQLAAAMWRSMTSLPAESAGTYPADRVHPGALDAAKRARLPMPRRAPRSIDDLDELPPMVVTVCDQAHEELDVPDGWLHWSIPDPVPNGSDAAFDATVHELRERIDAIVRLPAVGR
jgi:ArsR family transcriptional regulator, arsenate/arsenite/antimonite-responsive transcriptional repressor / arsenate reductase (thioredoxin)